MLLSSKPSGVLSFLFAALLCQGCGDSGNPDNPRTDLRITKTANRDSIAPSDTVRYTVTVRNLGPLDATNVFAGDTLPTGLSLVSTTVSRGTFSGGLWNIGALRRDSSAVLTMLARADPTTTRLVLVNLAGTRSTAFYDSVPGNDTASRAVVVASPAAPPPPPPPPPPASVVFSSSWGTSTGNTGTAVTDGGTWNEASYCNRNDILSVVSGASVGFTRATNVFAVAMRGDNGCGFVQRRGFLAPGVSHWGRFYFRNDETQMGGSQHNFSYNFLGQIQLIYFNRFAYGNGWTFDIRANAPFPFSFWTLQPGLGNDALNPPRIELQNRQWYRYEWQLEYLNNATRYRIWPRVYNAAGTLLYDASNFYQMSTPVQGTATLATWYAAGNSFAVIDLNLMANIGLGNEGRVPSPNNGQFWYVGNFAIGTAGWIGP